MDSSRETGVVRTRFAPSPTGYLHVGGVRTALFAWLLARQNNGEFVLRLEDTDKTREVEGTDEHLINSLKTLGLNYDEGPDIGGQFGPYKQSERLETYKKWANKLLDDGNAYVDPYSPAEVQKFRGEAQANKKAFLYRNYRPDTLDVSWDGTKALRFKSDPTFYAHWTKDGPVVDEVMGELNINPEAVDDFILIKSDGYPTYNFAHIIDDYEMQISHIIRGQEFLSSMPNYLNLYHVLDFTQPKFAHLPHILNEAGNKKLSKRDGAKDSLEYIKEGMPLSAFINFIASLGWNDGTEQEIFSIEELISKFSLDRVQSSGARFDEKRLKWMSGMHIRNMDLSNLYQETKSYWSEESSNYPDEYRKSILSLIQERLKLYKEIPDLTKFFFVDLPIDKSLIENHKHLSKFSSEELKDLLQTTVKELQNIDWQTERIQDTLNDLLDKTGKKPVELFSLIRIAITQAPSSPGLAETLQLLGREKSLQRIEELVNSF